MRQWTIDRPDKVTFETVRELNVRIVAGRLAVLAGDGPPSLEVADIESPPLIVTYDDDDGTVTVAHKELTWDGVLDWLRPARRSATLTLTVPKDCPVRAAVVSASALMAGLENRTWVKSVSGEVVLDGVSGAVHTETVTGPVESRGLAGDLAFRSVSGELTVADGTPRRLRANTISGRITADLSLPPTGHVTLNSVSGPILVRLPHAVEADVTLRSTAGRLDSSFEELSGRDGDFPGVRSLSGRLGGGMASLTVTTLSADVTLIKGETR